MKDDLPKGWIRTELENCFEINYGKGLPKSKRKDGPFPVYGSNGPVGFHNQSLTQGITIIIGRKGSVGAIHLSELPCWPIDTTYYIDSFEIINSSLARYLLEHVKLFELESSSAIPGINRKKIYKMKIPLPPLNEQRRIAGKLEKIMPRLDGVTRRLERIPTLIKRFRQSVLTAAVTGKLTEKWRQQHPDVENAENIIKSIKKERIADAKAKTQIKKIDDLYDAIEKGDSNELPDKWKYTFLNKLCESFQYGTSCKSQKTGIFPVLRMGNLQNGHIDWSNLVYTSDKNEIEKYSLKPGDVLFNRTNSADLVGKTSIYLGEQPAIYAGYLIKINNYDKLDSKYLNYALNSQYAKNFCRRVKSDGVNQSNINAQKLGKFEIPLPPLEEQEEIVRQVDKLFAFADKLELHYKKAKQKIQKMPQAILAKAFRGQLVPQYPSDEPASILLEKIKTQKHQMESKSKKNKRKK